MRSLFGGGLFQSEAERRRRQDRLFRQQKLRMERHLKQVDKDLKNYRELAVRARQIESAQQFNNIRDHIRRALAYRSQQQRLLLSLETAMQVRNQAQSMKDFANAMNAMGNSMRGIVQGLDFEKMTEDYDKVMEQADEMEHQVNDFLEQVDSRSSEAFQAEDQDIAAIDRMLAEDFASSERRRIDDLEGEETTIARDRARR